MIYFLDQTGAIKLEHFSQSLYLNMLKNILLPQIVTILSIQMLGSSQSYRHSNNNNQTSGFVKLNNHGNHGNYNCVVLKFLKQTNHS